MQKKYWKQKILKFLVLDQDKIKTKSMVQAQANGEVWVG